MYVLPSTSFTCAPLPSLMNTGVPPTALNARTGELTPPGMSCRALAKAASELTPGRRWALVLLLVLLLVSDITNNIAVPPQIARGPGQEGARAWTWAHVAGVGYIRAPV